MPEWRVLPDQPDAEKLASALGSHPLVAQVLAQRGFRDAGAALAFVDPAHYHPAAPEELPDLALAADLLQEAVAQKRRILIWGDFDVDGQTATALLKDGLTRLGLAPAFYVPHRLRKSHGILVESLATQLEAVQLMSS
jgi:single-stranded-DNA-specific exonuclease